jgi:hypothetical protein
MVKIQGYIIKRGKRNTISRFFYAKNDRGAIAAWKSDLDRICNVFKVCPLVSVRQLLTFRFQTELAIIIDVNVTGIPHDTWSIQNTGIKLDLDVPNVGVSEVHHEGVNVQPVISGVHYDSTQPRPIASEVRSDLKDSCTVASNVRHNMLEGREGGNQAVSTNFLRVTE